MIEKNFVKPKHTVYHVIPWNSDKLIGKSYNQTMSLINDDDWVCFLDGDAVHTSPFFGKRIEDVIDNNPDYFLFTSYTNRIGNMYQIPTNVDKKNNDQGYHRQIGDELWEKFGTTALDVTSYTPLSGVIILIKKKYWSLVGGFSEVGMLGVDNDIHIKFKNNGYKVGLMRGIYVQYWYRGGNASDKSHLL
jgi:GT2 family glycosyltransferase